MTLNFTLRIESPDEIDADTRAEIEADRDPQDVTWDAAVTRWLGGFLSETEGALSASLPEGWYARVTS